jgi:hypothetical protein
MKHGSILCHFSTQSLGKESEKYEVLHDTSINSSVRQNKIVESRVF